MLLNKIRKLLDENNYKPKEIEISDKKYPIYTHEKLNDEQFGIYQGILLIEAQEQSEISLLNKYKIPLFGYAIRIAFIFFRDRLIVKDYRKEGRQILKTIRKINNSFFKKIENVIKEPTEQNIDKLFDRTDIIDEFYILFVKSRNYLLNNIKGITEENKRNEFIDNFMMQMLTLWYLQEREFFNKDANYFITKFKEYKQKQLFDGFNSFYDFLTYFFEKISNNHQDSSYYYDDKVGKIIIIGPAVFLNGNTNLHKNTISIPDECFYKENYTETLINENPKNLDDEVPLLNLFESRDWTEGNIDEFVLGAIFEKLMTYEERKKTGAYYTPEEITSYICKNTIEPYLIDKVNETFGKDFKTIDEVINSKKEVLTYLFNQLKEIKILDPAVGSGHFLESAINILLSIYEKIWEKVKKQKITNGFAILTSNSEGEIKSIELIEIDNIEKFRLLIKFYIILSNNLYGVDINPSAIKVARARLFLTIAKHFNSTQELFVRFPNVHFNLREGNSLIGYIKPEKEKQNNELQYSFSFVQEEHPIYVIEKIKIVEELKPFLEIISRNLNISGNIIKEIEELNQILSKTEIKWEDLQNVLKTKEKLIRILIVSLNSQYANPLNDLLREITNLFNHKLDEKFAKENQIELQELKKIKTFHWFIEFPEVFLDRDGFDVVVGNPPWDKVKPHDPEFFEKFEPNYRELSKSNQKIRKEYLLKDKNIKKLYDEYLQYFYIQMELFKNNYNLQGDSGDINLYKLFLEKGLNLSVSKICFLIPGQITVDQGNTQIRDFLLKNQMIYVIIGFTNKTNIFPGIDNNQKFALLFIDKEKKHKKMKVLGWLSEFKNFSENSLIEISNQTYKRFDKYFTFYLEVEKRNIATFEKIMNLPHVKRLEELNFHYWQEYHATNDSKYFNDKEGKYLLFSGKAIDQYDYMAKIWIEKHGRSSKWKPFPFPKDYKHYRTEYYVDEIPDRILEHHKMEQSNYRIVVQNISGAVNNVRTIYACLLHKRHLTNNSLHNIYLGSSDVELLFYLAILNSFVLDWQARMKVATNLNKFIIETFLIPSFLDVEEELRNNIVKLSLQLSAITPDFDDLAKIIYDKNSYTEIGIIQESERQKVKNKIDALVAYLYCLTYQELDIILNSFALVSKEIKEQTLNEFNIISKKS
ncbi:MAG: hypothetical protein KatS3mg068_2675 [Candidatus Sericytochromatia bacterium]|nr:MAG: hypothetical protein KatS3mg068_2675 [Candidatus Sericytochromatia bacterium]GIX42027.1 MAG: hypothetical protein KatS3mg129_1760 [Leptospiraceae bacterium]